MTDLDPIIHKRLQKLVDLRHRLHEWPELAFEEVKTAEEVRQNLYGLPGLSLRTGVAETGVVAVLEGELPGPCVALRADMDALPIQEETGVPWASRRPGLMHACGHDGHTTCLIGAAQVLSDLRRELRGTVKFIFQPAEERLGGARRMVQEGALENPRPEAIFGMHGWPTLEAGTLVGWRSGPLMASSTELNIHLRAKGGHAAMPHLSADPVVLAAQIITMLQSIPARFTNPLDSVVISITKLKGGDACNVIPTEVHLGGTVRALRDEVGKRTRELIQGMVQGLAQAWGAEAEVTFSEGYPVTFNHATPTRHVRAVAERLFAREDVPQRVTKAPATMGAEDFSYYGKHIPASFWFLGLRDVGRPDLPRLHQSTFDFPDERIPAAVRMHCELALGFADFAAKDSEPLPAQP